MTALVDSWLQRAISLEDGGDPHVLRRDAAREAEKGLRLFAQKVLPAAQAMPTPINPESRGAPTTGAVYPAATSGGGASGP